jgi:hypothetical protein
MPTLASGVACPVSGPTVDAIDPQQTQIVGSGPIYTILGRMPGVDPKTWRQDGGWYYLKVLWMSRATYQGPAVIRGRQIDGSADVRFGDGSQPDRELRFPAGDTMVRGHDTTKWRDLPSYARISGPGCYGLQVDGPDFSYSLVFEVIS